MEIFRVWSHGPHGSGLQHENLRSYRKVFTSPHPLTFKEKRLHRIRSPRQFARDLLGYKNFNPGRLYVAEMSQETWGIGRRRNQTVLV